MLAMESRARVFTAIRAELLTPCGESYLAAGLAATTTFFWTSAL